MKLKSILLAAACAAFISSSAFGAISLTVSFTPTLSSGSDPQGFDGSTWTFEFNSNQTTYSSVVGEPAVVTDSTFLTVSGATNNAYNGTFAITDITTTNFASLPDSFGSVFLGIDANAGSGDFNFGPGSINVNSLGLQGTPIANPGLGDPILLSDFQGASVSDAAVLVGGDQFNFGSGTVNAAVPEPATTAALAGLAALAFVVYRRRKLSTRA